MKTVAYLKASKDRQDIRKQKQEILSFAAKEQISISRFIEIPISSKTTKENRYTPWTVVFKRYTYCQ